MTALAAAPDIEPPGGDAAPADEGGAGAPTPQGCRRVLFVDDEEGVLKSLARLFRRTDLDVTTTASPDEVRRLVRDEEFAVVVSDQRMPEIEGTRLLEEVRDLRPETLRISLTGYADKEAAIEAINRGSVYRFLTKPWEDDELRAEIARAVEEYNVRAEVRRLTELTRRQNAELAGLNEGLERRVAERTAEVESLHADLKASFNGSILVIASLAERHSPVVGSHSKRVAATTRKLAAELGLSKEESYDAFVAALLHDVGKIGLPPEVANKPESALGPHQREKLRGHVVEGERLAAMVPNLKNAAKLVRHHHEKWNGGGYPDRLVGEAIPLGARLIAVANAYDRALNDRERFAAMTPESALAEVARRVESDFDPDVVAALGRTLTDGDGDGAVLEIDLRDLKPGLKLADEVRTVRGVMLLPNGTVLTEDLIRRVTTFAAADPLGGPIRIARERSSGNGPASDAAGEESS